MKKLKTPPTLASALPTSREAIVALKQLGYDEQSVGHSLWNRMLPRTLEIQQFFKDAEADFLEQPMDGVQGLFHHRLVFDVKEKALRFLQNCQYFLPSSFHVMTDEPIDKGHEYEICITQTSSFSMVGVTSAVCFMLVWAERLDGEHELTGFVSDGRPWLDLPVPKPCPHHPGGTSRYRLRCADAHQVRRAVEQFWPWLRRFSWQPLRFATSPVHSSCGLGRQGALECLTEIELAQGSPGLIELRRLLERESSLASWACTLNHANRFTGWPYSVSA